MKKRKTILVLMTLFAVLFISGCKQNVGTPEDNAVVEETEKEEDQTGGHVYGFCASDLEDPFCEVLKESVGTAVSEEGSRILVRDAGGDAGLQNSQIHELKDTCPCLLMVPERSFLKRLDSADGVIGGCNGKIDIPYALALDRLYIAVTDQLGDGPADCIAGTVIGADQGILRRKKLLVCIFFVFNFLF